MILFAECRLSVMKQLTDQPISGVDDAAKNHYLIGQNSWLTLVRLLTDQKHDLSNYNKEGANIGRI